MPRKRLSSSSRHSVFTLLLFSLTAALGASCKSTNTQTKGIALASSAPKPGLTTGPNPDGMMRIVPINKLKYVMPPAVNAPAVAKHLQGIYYARLSQPNAKGHYNLADGLIAMSPGGEWIDANTVEIKIAAQGRYAFQNDGLSKDLGPSPNFTDPVFRVTFKDAEHAELAKWQNMFDEDASQPKHNSTEHAEQAFTMEWVPEDAKFGPHWLRHSWQSGQPMPDYQLLPFERNESLFLDDMKTLGIDSVTVDINADALLAKPGSAFPDHPVEDAERQDKSPAQEAGDAASGRDSATGETSEKGDSTVHPADHPRGR